MEIYSKLVANSGKALAMLDNLQVFFEENDAYDEFLWSVTSLMKRVKKWEYNLKNKKMSLIFSSNLFCSYEYKPKKYWKRKINHLKVFVFIFYLQSMSSLSSFLTKIEIRLSYRKISTMMFLSIKKSFLSHRITRERLLCVILSFAEILTSFWSNLYKADTCLYGHRSRSCALYTGFTVAITVAITRCSKAFTFGVESLWFLRVNLILRFPWYIDKDT